MKLISFRELTNHIQNIESEKIHSAINFCSDPIFCMQFVNFWKLLFEAKFQNLSSYNFFKTNKI